MTESYFISTSELKDMTIEELIEHEQVQEILSRYEKMLMKLSHDFKFQYANYKKSQDEFFFELAMSDAIIAFLNGYKKYDESKGHAFSTYIFQCVKNFLIKRTSKQRKLHNDGEGKTEVPFSSMYKNSEDFNEDWSPADECDSYEEVIDKVAGEKLLEDFKEYITTISDRDRKILTLRILDGYSFTEIAKELDTSHVTASKIVSRHMNILRNKFRC